MSAGCGALTALLFCPAGMVGSLPSAVMPLASGLAALLGTGLGVVGGLDGLPGIGGVGGSGTAGGATAPG